MADAPMNPDSLEAELTAAAARALRRRADNLRKRAALGVTVLDSPPGVVVIDGKSANLLRITGDWERIADELESQVDEAGRGQERRDNFVRDTKQG
jgi:hypothetical protein